MRREFYIRTSGLVCALLGLAVAGGIRLAGQTAPPEAERFEAGAGVHRAHAQPESLFQLPNTNELSPQPEPVSPPPPTRSSLWRPGNRQAARKAICSMFPPTARSTVMSMV